MKPHFTLLAIALLAAASLAQLPDIDEVRKDAEANLSKKRTWTASTYGVWDMDHEKVAEVYPPDTAKHPFSATSNEDEDGVHTELKGLVIYRRAGENAWTFNRIFVFEDSVERIGAKQLDEHALFEIARDGLARNKLRERTFPSLRATGVTHVHSITVPDDADIRQASDTKMEFNVEIEFDWADKRGRRHLVERKRGLFRVTAMRVDGKWKLRSAGRKGEFSVLESREISESEYQRMPRLEDTDLAEMFGSVHAAVREAAAPPAPEELEKAFVASYSASARQLSRLLGQPIGDFVEIEAVKAEPFPDGAERPEGRFSHRVEVRFTKRTGYRRAAWKIVRCVRTYSVSFVFGGAAVEVEHGRPSGREQEVGTVVADARAAAEAVMLTQRYERGMSVAPTGGAAAQPAAPATGAPKDPATTPAPKPAATLTDARIVESFRKTIDAGRKNFDGVMGRDMSKKVVDVEDVKVASGTLEAFDGGIFQVMIDVRWTWKRFDDVLMRSERRYLVKLSPSKSGGHYVSASRGRAREKELGKVNSNRQEVAAMPLYTAKKAVLIKQPKPEPQSRPRPRRRPRRRDDEPGPRKALRGLLGGG